jgi:hypothetical protein
VKVALALTGCLCLAAVLAAAWAAILSAVPLWAIAPLVVLIVVMAVRDP